MDAVVAESQGCYAGTVFLTGFEIKQILIGVLRIGKTVRAQEIVARFKEENDGTVAVSETRLPGIKDHICLPVSHSSMVLSKAAADQASAFLLRGEKTRAFTLFATHYFELTALAAEIPDCNNVHLDATEHKGRLVFLHAVKPGPANRSYGLQVAALAGVPPNVIRRAKSYMAALEAQQSSDNPQGQLELRVAAETPENSLQAAMDAIDPDELTPRSALEKLYELKKLSHDS